MVLMEMLLSTALTLFLLLTIYMASTLEKKNNMEKKSMFECGFNQTNSPKLPFSSQFFMLSITFLIFDIEISMLLPHPASMEMYKMSNFSLSIILLILLIATLKEWEKGMFEWSNLMSMIELQSILALSLIILTIYKF